MNNKPNNPTGLPAEYHHTDQVGLRALRFSLSGQPTGPSPDNRATAGQPRSPWPHSAYLAELRSLGFNALVVDALDGPETSFRRESESTPAAWEDQLARFVTELSDDRWWVMAAFPLQLDVDTRPVSKGATAGASLSCRLSLPARRIMLHRFETLIRNLPAVQSVGLVAAEWSRCSCGICQDTPFEEEVAYYLRAFSAILQRYRPELELWLLPDLPVRQALEEIRSQVPPQIPMVTLATLSVSPANQFVALGETDFTPEAVWFDLTNCQNGVDWLPLAGCQALRDQWESSYYPQLAAVRLTPNQRLPVRLAALLPVLMGTEFSGAAESQPSWLPQVLPGKLPLERHEWLRFNRLMETLAAEVFRSDRRLPSEALELTPEPPSVFPGLFQNLAEVLPRAFQRWQFEREVLKLVQSVQDWQEMLTNPDSQRQNQRWYEAFLAIQTNLAQLRLAASEQSPGEQRLFEQIHQKLRDHLLDRQPIQINQPLQTWLQRYAIFL